MSDLGGQVLACAIVVLVLLLVGGGGMAVERGRVWMRCCDAACRKYHSERHNADEAWCVCKNGIALKHDESGLYSGSDPTKQ